MIKPQENRISIKQLLTLMDRNDASDLYITAELAPSYRINGRLHTLKQPPLSGMDCERLATSTMNERQRSSFSMNYEMNLALSYDDIGRFRVNIFRQRGCTGMVIRKVKSDIPDIPTLGLPEIFKDIIMAPRGLVLLVGATGCGKSTSLAAMIDWRNSSADGHIICIEDPIEYVHKHKRCVITQREIGTDTIAYQDALKNTLRQAPDVILIGEIRDRETMEHALVFAETGHLCLATLHANNSNQALERIINFFPEEMHTQVGLNLALNMKAILSQRLTKTPDDKRCPATEVLVNTPLIADLIGRWDIAEIKQAMSKGKNYGMHTFDQSLVQLWMDGRISEDEAMRHADSVNTVRLQIKMIKLKDAGSDGDGIDRLSSAIDSSGLSI